MKYVLPIFILFISFISVTPIAQAISAEDIELLISIGAIRADKADVARTAISTNSVVSQPVVNTATAATQPWVQANGCISLPKNLFLGITDDSVMALQQFLASQGYLSIPTYTRYFGPATRDAVSAFQIAQGLVASTTDRGAGSVGPMTIAKIAEVSCPAPEQLVLGQGKVSIDSVLVYENQMRGQNKYQYAVKLEPATDVAAWNIMLVCDGNQINTNDRTLKKCGDSKKLSGGSKGKKTFSLQYTNTSRANQMVGIVAQALDKNGVVIDTAEVSDYVAAAGVRDLTPTPGTDLRYRIVATDEETGDPMVVYESERRTHTSDINTLTGTDIQRRNTTDPAAYQKCLEEQQKILARWSSMSTKTHWRGDGTLIDTFALPVSYRTKNPSTNNADKLQIIQPNNRTLLEIFEAYKNTHTFPTLEYVSFLDGIGKQYAQREKSWQRSLVSETAATTEEKRKEISTIIPSVPPELITQQRIDSEDKLVVMGELFASNSRTDNAISAPTARWVWQYRTIESRKNPAIVNGGIEISTVSVTDRVMTQMADPVFCNLPLSNDSYDIILFKK